VAGLPPVSSSMTPADEPVLLSVISGLSRLALPLMPHLSIVCSVRLVGQARSRNGPYGYQPNQKARNVTSHPAREVRFHPLPGGNFQTVPTIRISRPVPEHGRMDNHNGTWPTSAQTTSEPGGTATVLLPCDHWYARLSPSEVQACQTVERSCGICRTVYDVAPLTNEALAWMGSYGPFPESGLTVLAEPKQGTTRH
jgi:hypothetical protein